MSGRAGSLYLWEGACRNGRAHGDGVLTENRPHHITVSRVRMRDGAVTAIRAEYMFAQYEAGAGAYMRMASRRGGALQPVDVPRPDVPDWVLARTRVRDPGH